MRDIVKSAVDCLYTFLVLKQRDHSAYDGVLTFGEQYTRSWDEPVLTKLSKRSFRKIYGQRYTATSSLDEFGVTG